MRDVADKSNIVRLRYSASTKRQTRIGAAGFSVGKSRAIEKVLTTDPGTQRARAGRASACKLVEKLTPRERQVLTLVVDGRSNKQIAYKFGTVEKTVKVQRGRMMAKLGARNVVDLIHVAIGANLIPEFQTVPTDRLDLRPIASETADR